MKPLVSIVIPTRNRKNQLERAIQSCLAQTYDRFEIVVVDDGSDEVDYLEAIKSRYPEKLQAWALLINHGGSFARNCGVDHCHGEFVVFLDSDDELQPHALEAHLEARRGFSDQDRVITFGRGRRVRIDRLGNRFLGDEYPGRGIQPDERVGEYLFSLEGKIFTPSMMVSRALLSRLKFNERLKRHQDYGFVLDAFSRLGVKFQFVDQVVFNWVSDALDEGSQKKGISLEVSREFLQLYCDVLSNKEVTLYLGNIAASMAVVSFDLLGLIRLYADYSDEAYPVVVGTTKFASGFAKRVYAKLFRR